MTILHLTDFHIAPNTIAEIHFRTQALCQALRGVPSEWRPTILAITGDLCRNGSEEEFLWGEVYLRSLLLSLELPPERVILCPGNHDAQYPDGRADYEAFHRLCDTLGVHTGQSVVDGYSFSTINTCRETTEIWYDRASIAGEDIPRLVPNSILLLHHPPELIREQDLLKRMAASSTLLLSGHRHVESPACTRYGAALSVNGIPLLSHIPGRPYGCQLIRVENGASIRVASLMARPEPEPHFVFKEYPHHVSS